MTNMKTRNRIVSGVLLVVFIIIAVIALFPIYYLFMASLQKGETMFSGGMKLFFDPAIMSFKNYAAIVTYRDGLYLSWYKNSLITTVMYTCFGLFFTSLVGYGLGAYDFKLRNVIFVMVLIVMMIPLEVLMLPLYNLIVRLRIIDTYWGVVTPFMVAPFAIFFFRQYVSGISKDFLEAARIDGCTEFGIFFRIMVPIMKPAFGAMTILLSMQQWNSFLWPLIVLRTNRNFTINVGLSSLLNMNSSNYEILFSGAICAIVPILVIFVFNQQFFISGLTAGGIKG